jgi:hypothetical protein
MQGQTDRQTDSGFPVFSAQRRIARSRQANKQRLQSHVGRGGIVESKEMTANISSVTIGSRRTKTEEVATLHFLGSTHY